MDAGDGDEEEEEEGGVRGRPGWREEQDLYAAAASAYTLLHGEAPPKGWGRRGEEGDGTGRRGGAGGRRWRLRRYWDAETWAAVFDGLVDARVLSSTEEVGTDWAAPCASIHRRLCTYTHRHNTDTLSVLHLSLSFQVLARLDGLVARVDAALRGPRGVGLKQVYAGVRGWVTGCLFVQFGMGADSSTHVRVYHVRVFRHTAAGGHGAGARNPRVGPAGGAGWYVSQGGGMEKERGVWMDGTVNAGKSKRSTSRRIIKARRTHQLAFFLFLFCLGADFVSSSDYRRSLSPSSLFFSPIFLLQRPQEGRGQFLRDGPEAVRQHNVLRLGGGVHFHHLCVRVCMCERA